MIYNIDDILLYSSAYLALMGLHLRMPAKEITSNFSKIKLSKTLLRESTIFNRSKKTRVKLMKSFLWKI